MCTGINNFFNTFSSAVVQTMFWGTCWWMLDELLLHSPFLISVGCTLLFLWVRQTQSSGPLRYLTPHWYLGGCGTLLWCYWKVIEPLGKKNSGGVWLLLFFCALWVCIYMCEWSISLFVCVCVFIFLASMCIVDLLFHRGYYAFML